MNPRFKVRYSRDGIHFFDRSTGLNVLCDDVDVPKESLTVAPRQVSIGLTNYCPLSCPFCYAPKNHAELDFEKLKCWILELDKNGSFGIGFGGGEPTYYRSFVDACRFVSQETNLSLSFTTNGQSISKNIVDEIQAYVNFVRISMDGVYKTYESLRKRPFSKLVESIKTLGAVADFGINFVVNNETIDDLQPAMDLATTLGASEMLFLPEVPSRRNNGLNEHSREKFEYWINNYSGTVRLSVGKWGSDNLPTCIPLVNETASDAFAHIDATGVVKKTSFAKQGVSITESGIMHALSALHNKLKN